MNTAERAVSNAQYVRRSRPVPFLVVSLTNPVTATAPAVAVAAVALVSALISAVTSSTVPVLIPEDELEGVVDTRR